MPSVCVYSVWQGCKVWVNSGVYNKEVQQQLAQLQAEEKDADKSLCKEYGWFVHLSKEGSQGLAGYLGSEKEQNFAELTQIISSFKNGSNSIFLKRMGRTPLELWYEQVDFSKVNVLIIEWTHGNSDRFQGVDIPVLLNSTPKKHWSTAAAATEMEQ